MKKPVVEHIREAEESLAEIMRESLAEIGDDLIHQVMSKSRRLTPSQKLRALSGIQAVGVSAYKSLLKTAFSVIALDALNQARKEIPKKKNVKLVEDLDHMALGEFERLPAVLQKKLTTQTNLLVGKQIGDIQKAIEFAYATAEEETDSDELITQDLRDATGGYLQSTAIESGAALNASSVINSARQAFFFDAEVLTEIEAFQFKNGDPVTEICQDLNNTIFSKDDPSADRYFPPLHWRCKSYIIAILLGNLGNREISKLKPSKASMEDAIQFSEQFDGPCGCHKFD